MPAARRRDSHSSGASSQKNTTTGTFSVAQTSMCSIPLNRAMISTPKQAGSTALTSRIAACSTSGGIAGMPNIPIPPALHTARTRGAVAMNAMPALMNGTFSPYCSVIRVFNMKSSVLLSLRQGSPVVMGDEIIRVGAPDHEDLQRVRRFDSVGTGGDLAFLHV